MVNGLFKNFLEKDELPVQATRAIGLATGASGCIRLVLMNFLETAWELLVGNTPAMALENILSKWDGGSSTMTFNPYCQVSSFDFAILHLVALIALHIYIDVILMFLMIALLPMLAGLTILTHLVCGGELLFQMVIKL